LESLGATRLSSTLTTPSPPTISLFLGSLASSTIVELRVARRLARVDVAAQLADGASVACRPVRAPRARGAARARRTASGARARTGGLGLLAGGHELILRAARLVRLLRGARRASDMP
jgi:hypothetical protein